MRALDYPWWLAARAAGITSLLLVAASVASGLAVAAHVGEPRLRDQLRRLHEPLAVTAVVAIATHGIFLLGDPWLRPGLSGVLVPLTLDYRPAWTALGIVAGWLAVVLGLSFYLRGRIGARRWRALHRAMPVVYGLALLHALGAGSDAAAVRALAFLTAVPILALVVARLGASSRRKRRAAAPTQVMDVPPGLRDAAAARPGKPVPDAPSPLWRESF